VKKKGKRGRTIKKTNRKNGKGNKKIETQKR
jgi:hypothetical protein